MGICIKKLSEIFAILVSLNLSCKMSSQCATPLWLDAGKLGWGIDLERLHVVYFARIIGRMTVGNRHGLLVPSGTTDQVKTKLSGKRSFKIWL